MHLKPQPYLPCMYLRRRCNIACNIGEQARRKDIIEVSTMQWYQPAGDERRGKLKCRGKKCRELVWLRWQEGRRHVLTLCCRCKT